jgi:hypothetical protein
MKVSSALSIRRGDTIRVLDGSLAKIEAVLQTERKTIYKIRFLGRDIEGYYEEDKISLHRQHPLNLFLDVLRMPNLFF